MRTVTRKDGTKVTGHVVDVTSTAIIFREDWSVPVERVVFRSEISSVRAS